MFSVQTVWTKPCRVRLPDTGLSLAPVSLMVFMALHDAFLAIMFTLVTIFVVMAPVQLIFHAAMRDLDL